MLLTRPGLLAAAASLVGLTAHAAGSCTLASATLPVTMEGLRPLISVQIDGVDTRMVVDTGAFFSMLAPAAATQLNLPRTPAPFGFNIQGVGGATTPMMAKAKTFRFGDFALRNVDFLVGGNELGSNAAGLLGQNILRAFDMEFDVANGVVRWIKPIHCGNQPLAYWAAGNVVDGIDLHSTSVTAPHAVGSAEINGVKIRVLFDTGSPLSMLSLRAAKQAGLVPGGPGVRPAGRSAGIGHGLVDVWIAPVDSFKIGDEEIKHTQVLIADIGGARDTDMLLGDDFFLAHRIYLAYSQNKAYFTYNGGPVFRLEPQRPVAGSPPDTQAAEAAAPAAANPAPDAAGDAAAATTADRASPTRSESPPDRSDQPTDAAGFERRGTAYAARRDLEHALTDLQHACELAPTQPDYFFERGRIESQMGRLDQAAASFDQALALQPRHLDALLARAGLRLRAHTATVSDLDAIDRVAAAQDDRRMALAQMYDNIGEFDVAVHQFDVWIAAHSDDVALAAALNGRCWVQAEANQNLDRALKDCNQALRMRPKAPAILDSRGLVYLRQGNLQRAIADYNDALAQQPKMATSLYGRGIAKARQGMRDGAKADLDAATALAPGIGKRFSGFGLKP